MAYFRADLCLYSPESYSLEEKKEICNDMRSTSKAVLDATREDFEQLPPDARARIGQAPIRGRRRPALPRAGEHMRESCTMANVLLRVNACTC